MVTAAALGGVGGTLKRRLGYSGRCGHETRSLLTDTVHRPDLSGESPEASVEGGHCASAACTRWGMSQAGHTSPLPTL